MDEQDIFQRFFDVIERRRNASPESSYVAGLMAGDMGRRANMLAAEVCLVAAQGDLVHLVGEISDLLLHTFVLAVRRGVALQQIRDELERRFAVSGSVEKGRRATENKAE